MLKVNYEDEKNQQIFVIIWHHIYHLQNLCKPVEVSYFIRLRFTNC